jgi:hypothetical protein
VSSKLQIFSFSPSAYLTLSIVFIHILALLSLYLAGFQLYFFIGLSLLLMLSAVYFVLRDGRLALAESWVSLRIEEKQLVLINRAGQEFLVQILPSSFVTPYLISLNFKVAEKWGGASVVLMRGSLPEDQARQLRLALKWRVPIID